MTAVGVTLAIANSVPMLAVDLKSTALTVFELWLGTLAIRRGFALWQLHFKVHAAERLQANAAAAAGSDGQQGSTAF